MKNVYKKYESMQILHPIMSAPLSFTAIAAMYLLISTIGYYKYGLAIFGYHWDEVPTVWQKFCAFFSHTLTLKFIFFTAIGFIVDVNAWPYFYKLKSANIDYKNDMDSELESEVSSESLDD